MITALEGVITRPLPLSGSVVLGRGEDADLCIPDPWMSRKHVRLHIGPQLRVEDLGSRNGTRISEGLTGVDLTSLDTAPLIDSRSIVRSNGPVEFAPGNVIHVGRTQITLRRRRPDAARGSCVERRAEVIKSPTMRDLYDLAERVAQRPINVLVLGETGAGKEVLAAYLHRASDRAHHPFLCLSCVALTETLLESELFGHVRGAFSGAIKDKPGLLETAEGGTVFLDEVGELPASIEAKLLRVIEDRKVTRVGGLHPKSIDVRFIAATNRDLEAEVARGAFCRDLYFRLCGIPMTIPPLRERIEEIEVLAYRFAAQAASGADLGHTVAISEGVLQNLWPTPSGCDTSSVCVQVTRRT